MQKDSPNPTRNRLLHVPGNLLIRLLVFIMLTTFGGNQPVIAQEGICTGPFLPVSFPLPELGPDSYVRMDGQVTDFSGGLYPNGSNMRPDAHEAAGVAASAQIIPRDAQGAPDPGQGRIVMVSIGMSNTNSEFGAFKNLARETPGINPRLMLINGALGGQTADRWIDPNALAWQTLDATLTQYGASPQQVQVAWVKQTLTRGGTFPEKAQTLQADLETIARHLKDRFPNLQVAYFSSRTRSYTYERGLSPEPLAFETAFSVKWMIEKQIQGDLSLNYDPALGPVRAPFLSWGPYLWADGLNPRADGFTWLAEDMTADCTHPTLDGQKKIAALLIDFFQSDTTTRSWFLANPPQIEVLPTQTTQQNATITSQPPSATAPTEQQAQTPSQSSSSTSQPLRTPTSGNQGAETIVISPTLEPSTSVSGTLSTDVAGGTKSAMINPACPDGEPCPTQIAASTNGGPAPLAILTIGLGLFAVAGWWLLRRPR